MRWITYKHTLTWDWDTIKVVDSNGARRQYQSAIVLFSEEILIRWADWEEEIPIPLTLSPMQIQWTQDKTFPYEVKGSWDLFILIIN